MGMGRAKQTERTRAEELWDEYQAIQLTPEQKAAARRRAEERVEQARRDGVYERAREIAGTVKWSIPWQELRDDE
jgi:hypothetical protein